MCSSDLIVKKILGDEEQVTCRPADLIEPELPKGKRECAVFMKQDEDVLTQVFFPKAAQEFFRKRLEKEYALDLDLLDEENSVYPV